MARLTIEDLVQWSQSECGGLIVPLAPDTFVTVVYFLREFAVTTSDPYDQLGAFYSGDFLVVGTRRFRDDVINAFVLGDEKS